MLNPSRYLSVSLATFSKKDLSLTAKVLFLDALATVLLKKKHIPIPFLPSAQNLTPKAIESAKNEVLAANLATLSTVPTGEVFVFNYAHRIFGAKETGSPLENSLAYSRPALGDLCAYWKDEYSKVFNMSPPRDNKDLLRLRSVAKVCAASTYERITEYIQQHRSLRTKCTTTGLYAYVTTSGTYKIDSHEDDEKTTNEPSDSRVKNSLRHSSRGLSQVRHSASNPPIVLRLLGSEKRKT